MIPAATWTNTIKGPFEENCECVDPTVGTPSPAPTPLAKSGKTPDHGHGDGEECALDVLQRAQMFANYMFEFLDENQDNELTPDEFCKLVDAETEDGFIKYGFQAAVAIDGDHCIQELMEVASDLCETGDHDPITLWEIEASSILHYCNGDRDAFISLIERGASANIVGAICGVK